MFGPKGNQNMLLRTPVQQWTTDRDLYEKMTNNEKGFWNSVKALLNKTEYVKSMVSYYQQKENDDVTFNQFDIVLDYIGDTKLGYLSSYRTIISKAKQLSSHVKVTVRKIHRSLPAQESLMSYMAHSDSVFFGCNDIDWLRKISKCKPDTEKLLMDTITETIEDEDQPTSEEIEHVDQLSAFGLTVDMFEDKSKEQENDSLIHSRSLIIPASEGKRKFQYTEDDSNEENIAKKKQDCRLHKVCLSKNEGIWSAHKGSIEKAHV
jgi:hypothetical protein